MKPQGDHKTKVCINRQLDSFYLVLLFEFPNKSENVTKHQGERETRLLRQVGSRINSVFLLFFFIFRSVTVVCLHVCLFVYLIVCLSVCVNVCLCVCLCVCLSVCLSVRLFAIAALLYESAERKPG